MVQTFIIGLLGSIILILGAAWPEQKTSTENLWQRLKNWILFKKRSSPQFNPRKSVKNWLLAIGGLIMLIYAILYYIEGGVMFFVFLQCFIIIASILMMLNTNDRLDFIIITISGLGFIGWSLYLFEGYNTIFFIIGLSGIGLGYAFQSGTLRRSMALMLGGALIAIFSYFEANWIFFWLNTFFAVLSGFHVIKELMRKK